MFIGEKRCVVFLPGSFAEMSSKDVEVCSPLKVSCYSDTEAGGLPDRFKYC